MLDLTRPQLVTALGAVLLIVLVLELVRRRRLSEEYSLPWVASSVVIAALGFSPPLLTRITHALGARYGIGRGIPGESHRTGGGIDGSSCSSQICRG